MHQILKSARKESESSTFEKEAPVTGRILGHYRKVNMRRAASLESLGTSNGTVRGAPKQQQTPHSNIQNPNNLSNSTFKRQLSLIKTKPSRQNSKSRNPHNSQTFHLSSKNLTSLQNPHISPTNPTKSLLRYQKYHLKMEKLRNMNESQEELRINGRKIETSDVREIMRLKETLRWKEEDIRELREERKQWRTMQKKLEMRIWGEEMGLG